MTMLELNSEARELHNLATLERGFVSAKANAGPVGRLLCVREWSAVFGERSGKFMCEVWMAAAVAAALREAQVRFLVRIIDTLRRVTGDTLGQAVCEVRALHGLGNLGLGQLRRVNHEWFV